MVLRMPWSVSFVARMTRHVSLTSALRLRGMVMREERPGLQPARVPVRVKHPFRADIWLREPGSDINTFKEVVLKQIYRTVVERAGACEYVLDLGGNIGLTSLYLASAFPTCRILTVEPLPENQELLALNLAPLVRAGRCQVVPGAVWREDTTLDLNPPPDGTGFDAVQVTAGTAGAMRQPTPAYTVDTLMRTGGFPRIDILKIDIEGAETPLFRGPTEWLARVNTIAVEFHGDSRRESGFDEVAGAAGLTIEDDLFPNTVVAYRPQGQRVR
jgi:FkbM family methyltransferase